MPSKTKAFFALYLLAGLLSLMVLLVSRAPGIAKLFVIDSVYRYRYGDLYDMCRVSRFRVLKPKEPRHLDLPGMPVKIDAPVEHDIDDSEMFFTGDSFLLGEYIGKQFEAHTGRPAYVLKSSSLTELQNVRNRRPKYLVYETVERRMRPVLAARPPGKKASAGKIDALIKKYMAGDRPLEFLVTNCRPLYDLLEARNTFRFSLLGEISEKTPFYSVDPPMLFYHEEVEFNQAGKFDAAIKAYADGIAALDRQLQDYYAIKMLFVIIPNKFTVYGYDYDKYEFNYSGLRYDNFIPRLQSELGKRGVAYADVYSRFMERRGDGLYHPSDTHWNEKGEAIALSTLIDLVEREEQKLRTAAAL